MVQYVTYRNAGRYLSSKHIGTKRSSFPEFKWDNEAIRKINERKILQGKTKRGVFTLVCR